MGWIYEYIMVGQYFDFVCRGRCLSLARSNLAELAVIVWRAATARCEHRILQIICSACRSDLPYIFRITLPAKNLSPFYPIRPEKYVDKPRFIWYIIQAIFCGYGPLVKRLRQRPLTPLTWVRFPHGSPKYSSLAQLVEHAAVNRRVVGSSPTGGARKST